tara:strand:- start:11 stop:205 length:195 start_codon:yes stop_codon:yes gene_type:complete
MKFILGLILLTQVGCSFIITTAGSFLGNVGADMVTEKMKEMKDMKDSAYCDPMGVRNCPKGTDG